MVKINLLPQKIRKGKVALQFYTYVVLAASVAGLLMILVLLNLLAQTKRVNAKIVAIEKAETALANKTAPLRELIEQENRVEQIQHLIRQLSGDQLLWIKVIDELADRTQPDLWLTTLHSEVQTKADGWLIRLEGEAYNKLSVADFLNSLERSTIFSQVNLEGLKEAPVKDMTQIQFKLRMVCQATSATGNRQEKKP